MKIILIIIFSVFGHVCFSQTIQGLDSVYQNILDNDKFVTEILKDTTFLCNKTLFLLPNDSDTAFNFKLTFKDKPIVVYTGKEKIKCPSLQFYLKKSINNTYKLEAKISKVVGSSGSCTFYLIKFCSCVLTKTGDCFEINNIKVGTANGSTKFM